MNSMKQAAIYWPLKFTTSRNWSAGKGTRYVFINSKISFTLKMC